MGDLHPLAIRDQRNLYLRDPALMAQVGDLSVVIGPLDLVPGHPDMVGIAIRAPGEPDILVCHAVWNEDDPGRVKLTKHCADLAMIVVATLRHAQKRRAYLDAE